MKILKNIILEEITMLEIRNLNAGYFGSKVLQNITLECKEGITLVVGPNGAGKTTLVKSINGLLRPVDGKINFNGTEIHNLSPFLISRLGISTVPERGHVFSNMTVIDNLRVAFEAIKQNSDFNEFLERIFSIFPDLKEKLNDKSNTLSGGQQQMLSIARAMATNPKMLIMDEPTTGLFPKLVKELVLKIEEISKNMPILLTEQNVLDVVPIARQVSIIESGKIVFSGKPEEVLKNPQIKNIYFGYREVE
ncbi:MAG: ABC transporter ATP-binding protein [Thermoplasmata archaeon]